MNLFSKGNSYLIVSIGKFLSQLYIFTQPRRAISSRHFFQKLNPSKVVLRTNTYRAENLITYPRRVIKANRSKSIIRPSKVHSILVVSKYSDVISCKFKAVKFTIE